MRCALVLALLALGCGSPPPDCPPETREAADPAPPPPSEPEAEAEPVQELPPSDAPTAGPDAHGWAELAFVDVDDAFGAGTLLEARLLREEQAMHLILTARWIERDVLARARVRMHLPDAVIEPGPDPLSGLGLSGGSRGAEPRRVWTHGARFPFQDNDLDEAWIEVDLGDDGRYWLEVPYGFVRDPSAPLPEGDRRAEARLASAMSELSARDHLVPFRHARYDVGEIQNGWRLEVLASNPFDPHVELVLYRDDGGVGQSAYRWDLHEPRTSVELVPGGRSLQMAGRLHEDGLRRSDHFTFFGRRRGRRGWGTLRATVAERTVEVRVPSSLYLYTHGTADPYHERRTVGAAGVLGGDLF